jgi:hypothetical protein
MTTKHYKGISDNKKCYFKDAFSDEIDKLVVASLEIVSDCLFYFEEPK